MTAVNKKTVPRHIAFIMDGNGRWAREKGLARTAGHKVGADRIKEIIRACDDSGVEVATFFAFSTENWNRPKAEIAVLMRQLNNFLEYQIKELIKSNMRLKFIGRKEPLSEEVQKKMRDAEGKTASNTGMTVVLALNYGSRQEIVDAAKKFAYQVLKGQAQIDQLNEDNFRDYFYTNGLPDPDLLVRTSGEMRVSNFLLWQLSYAELYFPKKYWPDFGKADLAEAIEVYCGRERRFGRIDAQKKAA